MDTRSAEELLRRLRGCDIAFSKAMAGISGSEGDMVIRCAQLLK